MRGITDSLDVEVVRQVLEERTLDIVGLVETFRGHEDRVRRRLGVEETMEEKQKVDGLLGDGWQWMERCRRRGLRGGVGLGVRKSVGVGHVMNDMCSDGMLWVKIELTGGGLLFVGVIYIAPPASPYVALDNAMEMLVKGLQYIRYVLREKRIWVLGDVNGRVGLVPVELEVDGDIVRIPRVSEDDSVNQRGMEVMGVLQSYGMMMMNGVDGVESGRTTCRGKSVVDWMCVEREMKQECSGMWVEEGWVGNGGGRKDGDHGWLRFDWNVVGRIRGEEEVGEGGNSGDGMVPARGRCRVHMGWRDDWRSVRRESDTTMRVWCEDMRHRGDGQIVETADGTVAAGWLQAHDTVIRDSIGWGKMRGKGSKRVSGYDKEISVWSRQMREITKEWMNEKDSDRKGELSVERKRVRSERQRRVRRQRTVSMVREMREIERLGRRGKGDSLMKSLENWSGKGGTVMGGDRERMRDGKGGWVTGSELVTRWRQTFEEVGRGLEAEGGFDDGHREQVEKAVDGWNSDWPVEELIEMEVSGRTQQTTLDGEIQRWEVKRVITRLKNRKAVGIDGVAAEVLKRGGDWMEESVWMLCAAVMLGEVIPVDWLRAIKVPLRKKGVGDSFDEYRGVTLLSVVGKVFGMVIESRLRQFCESRGILSDSQFGFRAGRACRDPLMILTEVMERRGEGERVFLGFLDVAKAYPSVWRKGLWYKLWDVGVRGRMWRVLRTLYSKCEVSVRVGGQTNDWYEEFVGVREGCVLSPLLYAIYINELPAELDREGCGGVRFGTKLVRCLMFADDVVLMATSASELQRMFDVVSRFAHRWRFKFNFGTDKTAVMVCGDQIGGYEWTLGGGSVPVVDNYKYLGIRLKSKGGWDLRRGELLGKARGAFWKAWGLGMASGPGWLSPQAAKGLWETLVRSVLEYGSEVDTGIWEQAEVLQRMAGRMCLGVGVNVPNVVIRGELGWWTMKARRQFLRLVYWGKVVRGPKGGMVRSVYEEGRSRLRDGINNRGEWCVETGRLLDQLGLGQVWETEDVGDEGSWRALVWAVIHEREELDWRREIVGKSTLGRYFRVKERLTPEWFLTEPRVCVRRWVGLRAGVTCLEETTGRYGRVPRDKRVCRWCESREVEDVEHFLDGCTRWGVKRTEMWDMMRDKDRSTVKRVEAWGPQDRVDWMLRGGGGVRTRDDLLRGVSGWLFDRERLK